MILTDESPHYETFVPKFEELGYGFVMPDSNTIVVDGEKLIEMGASSDLFKFIEAHEVAHILLNHDGPRREEQEIEADLGAYLILKKYNYIDPIKLLLKNFKFRHGIKFDESMLEKVKKRLPDI
jgi:predicted nicotinamide N-methyase